MSYIGTEPKDVRSFGRAKFDYTASQGQTAFTGADDDGKTLGFTDGQIEVFVNGILMDESDFSTSNGNTVTLASAANLNDIVSITALQTDIPNSDYVPATGGTFSGDVDFGSNKITYANLYNNVSDLPSASTYHGMFAHVHNTGLAYYSHAGAWIPLANTTGATFSGNIVASDGINLGGTGASNKLEDYEEGTWTPAFASGSVTLQANSAFYIKIGKLVTAGCRLANPTDVSSTGIVTLTGLPFTINATYYNNNIGSVWGNRLGSANSFYIYSGSSNTNCGFYYGAGGSSGYSPVRYNSLYSDTNMIMRFHYMST
tara:strand:- start:185 stop:1129 length:945 start_codon:yes stop_codon:yes gene_type:complete